jgi:hypothetical protein
MPAALAGALPAARPNILFVMVDSLSKGLAYSALPQTMKLLGDLRTPRDAAAAGPSEEEQEEGGGGGGGGAHEAFEFLRFNVVSSGTHNNVPAYLAGRKYAELPAAGL